MSPRAFMVRGHATCLPVCLCLCLGSGIVIPGAAHGAGGAGKKAADAGAAKPAGEPGKPAADPATVKLVEYFLKVPTADLPAGRVPEFIEVDPELLPRKLRKGFRAKREELLALKRVADGRRKPPVRRLTVEEPAACSKPMKGHEAVSTLRAAGYEEVYDHELLRLMKETKCSECELEEEFTLKRVLIEPDVPAKAAPARKGAATAGAGPPMLRYFLHSRDPIMTLIGAYRADRNAFGTNFFGLGRPQCH